MLETQKYLRYIGMAAEEASKELSHAAHEGNIAKVRELLAIPGINVNRKNTNGHTSLIFAAWKGHTEVVKTLLDVPSIEINLVDNMGDTPLIAAAYKGHLQIVELLMKKGADIHIANNEQNTAFITAVYKEHPKVVKLLLDAGANVNETDNMGMTPLILAGNNGNTKIFKTLMAVPEININHADENGDTALIRAAFKGHSEIVKILLSKEVDVNKVDKNSYTALIAAVEKDHIKIVELLLKVPEININHVDIDEESALMNASRIGNTKIIKTLLAKGADVNLMNDERDTALMLALHNKNIEVAILLLAVPGIDVNHRDEDGRTALMLASMNSHTEVVKALLATSGIDVNLADEDEITALIFAVDEQNATIVKLLLRAGANVNYVDNDGDSALIVAVDKGDTEIIELLLATPGININHAGENGNTALLNAAFNGYTEIVQILVAKGVDVNQANDTGNTALFWGAQKGHIEILRTLLNAGANVNHAGDSGDTALTLAASEGHMNIIRLLLTAGANINHACNSGRTALMNAAINGHIELVRFLIATGVNVNDVNEDGNTALMLAAEKKRADVVLLLLAIPEIEVNRANNIGNLPLTIALNKDMPLAIINSLIGKTREENINYLNAEGKTPLQYALGHRDVELRLNIVRALLEKHADPRIGIEPTPYTNAMNRIYTDEINRLIRTAVPIPPAMVWKGYTRGDVSMLNDVFLNPEEARATSFCPVCLAVVKHNQGCMYMNHECPRSGRTYDVELYNKYKTGANTIYWCTICGRICNSSHDHYRLGPADGPKPALITNKRGTFFDPDCSGQGGGGLNEKLKRMHALRESAIRLNNEIGRITKEDAHKELVESAWDAPLTGMRGIIERTLARQQFNHPNTKFPPNVANNNVAVASAPYPNAANPALFPVVHAEGYDPVVMEDVSNAVQFRHRKADGTINNHTDTYIGIDTLFRNIFSDDKPFGMCWNYAGGCTARIYPQELASILTSAVGLTPEKRAEYQAILNTYANRFDRHMAAAVGGGRHKTYKRRKQHGGLDESESMFPMATDAVCSLPAPKSRRTYRKKQRKGTKRR